MNINVLRVNQETWKGEYEWEELGYCNNKYLKVK